MLHPNRDGLRTTSPDVPPVHDDLLSTAAYTAIARPRVTIAREMPRVRSAGRPTTRPPAIVAATAIASDAANGRCGDSRVAMSAAAPARTNCVRESCPP